MLLHWHYASYKKQHHDNMRPGHLPLGLRRLDSDLVPKDVERSGTDRAGLPPSSSAAYGLHSVRGAVSRSSLAPRSPQGVVGGSTTGQPFLEREPVGPSEPRFTLERSTP